MTRGGENRLTRGGFAKWEKKRKKGSKSQGAQKIYRYRIETTIGEWAEKRRGKITMERGQAGYNYIKSQREKKKEKKVRQRSKSMREEKKP